VENRRDEAIALGNRALLRRMLGDNGAAGQDYADALALYREVGFREGEASVLMGLARLDALQKNPDAALEKLTYAAAIYEALENPGFLAEAYVQLGQLYKQAATPGRRSRDLCLRRERPA
jgi:tetratricopeptide (TPR) repeat protein